MKCVTDRRLSSKTQNDDYTVGIHHIIDTQLNKYQYQIINKTFFLLTLNEFDKAACSYWFSACCFGLEVSHVQSGLSHANTC